MTDKPNERPPWPDYFFQLADLAATRSTCNRLAVGVVIVRDNRVIGTGYNGAPPGDLHCISVGCDIEDGHCVRTVHAEENAVFTAARFGIPLEDAEAYVTHEPCQRCTKALRSAGVRAIHHKRTYDSITNDKGAIDEAVHGGA